MISTASRSPGWASIVCSIHSRNAIRFGSPVRESWWAWKSLSIEIRALLCTAAIGRSNNGTSPGWSFASTITIGESEVSTSAVDAWKPKSRRR